MFIDQRISKSADFLPSVKIAARHMGLRPKTRSDFSPERVERVHAELELQRSVRFPVGIENEIVEIFVLRLVVEHRVVELIEHPDRAIERHFHHDVDVRLSVS